MTKPLAKGAETISLADLLRRAVKDPPSVRRALAVLERARAEARAAGALWYPSLAVEGVAGMRYSNQPFLLDLRLNALSYDLHSTAGLDWSALNMARSATISARDTAVQSEQSTSAAAHSTRR